MRPGVWVPVLSSNGSVVPLAANGFNLTRCLHARADLEGPGDDAAVSTCGEVGELTWPALALAGSVRQLVLSANTTQSWGESWGDSSSSSSSNSSGGGGIDGGGEEELAQRAIALQLFRTPVPLFQVMARFGSEVGSGGCGDPQQLIQVASGSAASAFFRFRRGSGLLNATASASCTDQNATVQLIVQAPRWANSSYRAALDTAASTPLLSFPPVFLGNVTLPAGPLVAAPPAQPSTTNATSGSGGGASPGSSKCRTLDSELFLGDSNEPPPEYRGNLVLSDGLPPLQYRFEAPVAPVPGESLRVRCALSPVEAAAGVATVVPSELTLSSSARLGVLTVVPAFQGRTRASSLDRVYLTVACAVQNDVSDDIKIVPSYQPRFNVSRALVFVSAPWPFFRNANVTYLMADGNLSMQPVLSEAPWAPSGDGDTADAAAIPLSRFEIVTWGKVNVSLVGDNSMWLFDGARGHFSADETSVMVGGSPTQSWVADDGNSITFEAPKFGDVCSNSSNSTGECPLAITVRNNIPEIPGYAVEISCPPFCPRAGSAALGRIAGQQPVAIVTRLLQGGSAGNGASQQPRILQVTGSATPRPARSSLTLPAEVLGDSMLRGELLLVAAPSAGKSATGIRYIANCTSLRNDLLDPLANARVCRNHSHPNSSRCVRGTGANCEICPASGLCPGGNRVWPRPGYYVESESASSRLVACLAPSDKRCVGWDEDEGRTACGVGYQPGSYSCKSCAAAFHPAIDGSCVACKRSDGSTGAILVALVYLVLGVAGAALAIVGITRLVIALLTRGGTIKRALGRVVQLGVWLISTVQVQVLVAQSSTSGLPPYIMRMYEGLRVFAFDIGAGHPLCVGRVAVFRSHLSFYGAAAVLLLCAMLVFVSWRRLLGCTVCGLRRREMRELFERDESSSALGGTAAAAAAGTDPDEPTTAAAAASGSSGGSEADVPRKPSLGEWVASSLWLSRVSAALSARKGKDAAGSESEAEAESAQRQREAIQAAARRQQRRAAVMAKLPLSMRLGVHVSEAKPTLRKLVLMMLTLLYPAMLESLFSGLRCETRLLRVATVRSMMGDGTTLTRNNAELTPGARAASDFDGALVDPDDERLIPVETLASDEFVICKEGLHSTVFYCGWAIIVLFVVGYPIVTLVGVKLRVAQLMRESEPEYPRALAADRERQAAFRREAPSMLSYAARVAMTRVCCVGKRYTGTGARAVLGAAAAQGGTFNLKEVSNPLHHLGGGAGTPRIAGVSPRSPGSSVSPRTSLGSSVTPRNNPMGSSMSPRTSLGSSVTPRSPWGSSTITSPRGWGLPSSPRGGAGAAPVPALKLVAAGASSPSSRHAGPPESAAAAAGVRTADDLVDASPVLRADDGLAYFVVSEFRASQFATLHVELMLALCMAVAARAWPTSSAGWLLGRSVFIWLALVVVGCVFAIHKPYTPVNAFLLHIKVFHLVLVACIDALNLVCAVINLQAVDGGASDRSVAHLVPLRSGLALCTFALSILFLLLIALAFGWSLYSGLEREAEQERAEAAGETAAALGASAPPLLVSVRGDSGEVVVANPMRTPRDPDAALQADLAAGGTKRARLQLDEGGEWLEGGGLMTFRNLAATRSRLSPMVKAGKREFVPSPATS